MTSRVRPAAGLLATVAIVCAAPAQAGSVRFFGNRVDDIDRIKIRIDDPDLPNDQGPLPMSAGISRESSG